MTHRNAIRTAMILISLTAGTWTWTGCGKKQASAPAKPSAPVSAAPAVPAATRVDAVEVRQERMSESIDAVGTLDANEKVRVKPEVGGRIVRIGFDEGQIVKKGDLLVELDPEKALQDIAAGEARLSVSRKNVLQQRDQLESARARIAQAQAGIEQAKRNVQELFARLARTDAALERARQDEARTRTLFQKEFKTQDDMERAVTGVKQAEADRGAIVAELGNVTQASDAPNNHPLVQQALAQLKAAKADERSLLTALDAAADPSSSVDEHPDVRRASAELNLLKARLSDIRLVAPMDGVLAERHVAVGDFVDKAVLLFELVDISSVKTSFMVPERYIGRIRIGQNAAIRVAPYPNEVFHGAIYYISPEVDVGSRSVQMKLRIPNGHRRLKPGMFANVQVSIGEFPDAIVIPEEAVVPRGGDNFVFVVEDNKASFRPIQTGLRHMGKVQIIEGLTSGQQVIIAGLQKITDGSPVQVNVVHHP